MLSIKKEDIRVLPIVSIYFVLCQLLSETFQIEGKRKDLSDPIHYINIIFAT